MSPTDGGIVGGTVSSTPSVQAHGGDHYQMPPINELDVVPADGTASPSGGVKSSRNGYASLVYNGRIAPPAAVPEVKAATFSRSGSGLSKTPPVGGNQSLRSGGVSKTPGHSVTHEASSGVKRSASQGSAVSRASTPAWARPIIRRAYSAGSTNTDRSAMSSAVSGIELQGLRKPRSMKVDYLTPCHEAYAFKEKCGEGGFGTVWKCERIGSNQTFAVKRTKAKEEKDMQRTIRELKAFERFSHPNLVTLHEVFLDQEHLYMVMDLCTGGDLHQFLTNYTDEAELNRNPNDTAEPALGIPTRLVAVLLWQMLAGMAYMHHNRFCHRDIKLQNYVIKEASDTPRLQLVDFGMAIRFRKGQPITGTMGTVKYMAPEVLKGPYNEKCDIWSIGVCTYILCTSRSPWGPKKSNQNLAVCILENQREKWPACDKPMALRNLIEAMMCRKVEARPSAKHLLKHSKWLRKNGLMQFEDKSQGSPSCCTVS